MRTTQYVITISTHLGKHPSEAVVCCRHPRRPRLPPTRAAPAHPPCAESERGFFSPAAGEADVDGSASREVCLGTGPSAQEARDAASRGPGEHPGGRGAEEERAQVAAPALSRALAGRDGSDTLGALSELGLESFHRWARALQGSEEGSLQRSLAAWSWGALGPVWV